MDMGRINMGRINKIEITQNEESSWLLAFDNSMPSTKYKSLLKLATALMKFAKGQNL